jgi:hypothetical protein
VTSCSAWCCCGGRGGLQQLVLDPADLVLDPPTVQGTLLLVAVQGGVQVGAAARAALPSRVVEVSKGC